MVTFSAFGIAFVGVVGIVHLAECGNRQIDIVNNCNNVIWIGAQGNPLPFNGGFQLDAKKTRTVNIPGNTVAGRIWARTGCSTKNGRFVCDTGDCGSAGNGFSMECKGIGGQPPATLAEFTLQENGQQDYYDISNVDGYNVGIKMEAIGGGKVADPNLPSKFNCGAPACTFNTASCPPELKMTDSTGRVSCASICAAINNAAQRAKFPVLQRIFANRDQKNLVCCECDCGPNCGCENPSSQHCCSPYNLPSPKEKGGKCRVENWPKASNGAQYDQVFKSQCADAYSWQFDDHKSTYLCKTANYKITFCP